MAVVTAAMILLAGCSQSDDVAGPTPIEEETFAPELGIDLERMTRTGSGLYLEDLVVGEGEAAEAGNKVSVAYVGWLADGTQFDSSAGGAPLSFTLGVGYVIKGWDEGLVGMRVGGRRRLVIPSHLGYGARRNGIIPAYSTLVFEVVLAGVE